jgi:hypothetical protein
VDHTVIDTGRDRFSIGTISECEGIELPSNEKSLSQVQINSFKNCGGAAAPPERSLRRAAKIPRFIISKSP